MINVTGTVLVNFLKQDNKVIKGQISYSKREKDNSLSYHNFNAVFVGDAVKYILENDVKNKTILNILSGVLENIQYVNKSGNNAYWLQVKIFQVERYEQENKTDKNPFS